MPASINLVDVMERVSHAVTRQEGSRGWQLDTKIYTAVFDAEGLHFSPRRPDARCSGDMEPGPDPEAVSHLRTIAVRHGEQVIFRKDTTASDWAVLGNTAQRLLNGEAGLTEHYQTRSPGVELTWVLSNRLVGSGPLDIEIELAGLKYAGASGEGHHFADASGTPRVRIGQATLVDARGSRNAVPVYADDDAFRVHVSSTLLAAVEFPIAIDPLISPEFGMDTPLTGEPAHGQGGFPAIASNGDNYLVVWEDRRGGVGTDVFGTRVSRNGDVLDVGGLALSDAPGDQADPAAASNGRDYLVVWVDNPATPTFPRLGPIHATGVTGGGVVLEPDGFVVTQPGQRGGRPAVASDGEDYIVVWSESRIAGALVSSAGLVTSGDGILISPSSGFGPRVASNGTNYLVAWNVTNTLSPILGTRVSHSGALVDAAPLTISAEAAGEASVASDGRDYLVVWTGDSHPDYNIYGARVGGDGALMDAARLSINTAMSAQESPNVGSDGTGYLVVWKEDARRGIYGTRVSSGGQVLDTFPRAIGTPAAYSSRAAVASSGGEYLVAWVRSPTPYFDIAYSEATIYGTFLSTAGTVVNTNGLPFGITANKQEFPRIASNGDNYLVVWEDDRDGSATTDIYGVRLSQTGEVLDPAGLAISTAVDRQFKPAVASDGRDYLAVWSDDRNGGSALFCTPITSAGMVLATNGIVINPESNVQLNPAVASSGGNYLVTWDDFRGVPQVRGRLLAGNGAALDTNSFVINPSLPPLPPGYFTPAVAGNGQDYLVVWSGYRDLSRNRNIYGARVSGAGHLLDFDALHFNESTNQQLNPAVASDGRDYFVVWQDLRSVLNYDIYGTRVTDQGVIANPEGQFLLPAAGFPALTSDGQEYLLTWNSLRGDELYAIYARRFLNDGSPADFTSFPIAAPEPRQGNPAVAANGNDFLVVYHAPAQHGVRRTQGNLILDWESQDVGSTEPAGGVSLSPPVFLLHGSGAGIGGTSDAFHFVWRPLEGDAQVTARVRRLDSQDPSAKAGVMIRETLSPGARHALMAVLQPPHGAAFERRVRTDELGFQHEVSGAAWVRLVRLGDTLIGYQSDDGVAWDLVWFTTIDLPNRVEVGLAVTGQGNGIPTTAEFDRVSVQPLTVPTGAETAPKIHLGGEPVGAPGGGPQAGFKMVIQGSPGQYAVEATTNFTAWSTIGQTTNRYGVAPFVDTQSATHSNRFYRVRKP